MMACRSACSVTGVMTCLLAEVSCWRAVGGGGGEERVKAGGLTCSTTVVSGLHCVLEMQLLSPMGSQTPEGYKGGGSEN